MAQLNRANCTGEESGEEFKNPRTYGDVIHLRLLAMLLNTNFKVWVEDDKYWVDVIPLIHPTHVAVGPVSDKTIYLILTNNRKGEFSGHYQLIMNISPSVR